MKTSLMRQVAYAAASLALATTVACSDSNNTATQDMGTGGGGHDMATGGGGNPDMQCYMNPMTHAQIINACTTADQIDKTPVTPLLKADGTLPPLPQ